MKKLAEMGYVAGENGGQQMGVRGVVVSGLGKTGGLGCTWMRERVKTR